jgi:hypothetical protein
MAENFTILPNFAQQESNTAVLQDGGFTDELLTSMRTKRAVDDAKHEKTQQELASSIDFKTGDIFDVDLKVIDGQKQEYLDWISANAEKIASHDLATLAKQKEWKGKIDMQVDKAIGRKQWYDKQTIYLTSPDGTKLGYGKQGDFDKLKKYKETALGEWEGYDKRNMFNEYDYFKDYNIEPQERIDDNGVTKITYSQTPAEDIIAVAQQKINSPQGIEYRDNMLDLADAAKNGQTVNATLEYYDIDDYKKNGDKATVKTIQLSELTPDNINSIIYFNRGALDRAFQNTTKKDVIAPKNPKSDDGNGGVKSDLTWVIDGLVDIKKGTGQSTTNTKSSQGKDLKMSNMFIGEKIVDKSDRNSETKTILTISNKGGKTYVTFKEDESKTGNAPLRLIENEWNELVLPILKDKYGDKAIEELKQYAKEQGVSSILGIPELKQPTNTTSTTNNPLNATTIKSGGNSNQKKKPNPTTNTINATNKVNGTTQTTTTVAPQNTTVAPKTNTPVAPNSTTSAPTTTNSSVGKSQQPQNDITNNYLNVLGKQYESMGKYKPDSYKNTWQYRPLQIDKNYDEAIKTVGNKRKDGALLTDAGYEAIDKFELGDKKDGSNNGGAPDGGSMRGKEDLKKNIITDGYSKTQEAEIKDYVENNIGMDIWNQLPEKLQTQVYSLAFNSVKDDRIIKGLAQALAPDKIKTDADRQKLTADEAKSIINNYFGKTTPPVTPKTTTTTPTAPQSTTTNTTNNVKPSGGNTSNPNADKTVTEPKKNDIVVIKQKPNIYVGEKYDIDESKVDSNTTHMPTNVNKDVYFQGKKYKVQSNIILTPKDKYGKQYPDTKNHPEIGWFIDTEKGRYFIVNSYSKDEFAYHDYWKKDDGTGSSPYKGKDIPNEAVYMWNDKNSKYSKDISFEKPNDLEVSVKSANYGDKEWITRDQTKYPSKINGKTTIYYSKSQGKYYRIQNTEAKGDIYVIVEKDANGDYFDEYHQSANQK